MVEWRQMEENKIKECVVNTELKKVTAGLDVSRKKEACRCQHGETGWMIVLITVEGRTAIRET